MGEGIRIPFNEIQSVGDNKYGMLVVTMTLPDGRTIEAINSYTPLLP